FIARLRAPEAGARLNGRAAVARAAGVQRVARRRRVAVTEIAQRQIVTPAPVEHAQGTLAAGEQRVDAGGERIDRRLLQRCRHRIAIVSLRRRIGLGVHGAARIIVELRRAALAAVLAGAAKAEWSHLSAGAHAARAGRGSPWEEHPDEPDR